MWEDDEEHPILDSQMVLGQFLHTIQVELEKRNTHHKKQTSLPWDKIVSEPLSSHTQIKALEDGLLIVTCTHPVYLQLLHIQKRAILDRVRTYYPSLYVFDIKGVIV